MATQRSSWIGRERPRPGRDPALEISREVLSEVFGAPGERGFRVEYWTGAAEPAVSGSELPFTLVLEWPGALRSMLLPPTDRSVGEAYARGDIDLRGDVEAAVRLGWRALRRWSAPTAWPRLWARLRTLPARRAEGDGAPEPFEPGSAVRPHSRDRDVRAVRFHYDVGNPFYELFLDRRMQYSCGDFGDPGRSLDDAQEAKLDAICRALRLRPGHRVLDVGCGWGGLLLFAAERYGVRGFGVTLSEEQAAYARRSAREADLGGRCRFEVRDYRELDDARPFDRVVSVGMIEHVGLAKYPSYFETVHRLLAPGGLFVNQGIVAARRGHSTLDRLRLHLQRRIGSFIHHYVFPDSDLVPVGRTLTEAERSGLEVRGVENLREHYAETLRRWVRRLESRWDEAVELVGESTCRVWRFYMGASAHLFQSGYLGCARLVLRRPDDRAERSP